MNKILSIAFVSGNLFAVSLFAANKDVIEQSFNVKPGGKLTMVVDRGSIQISTSDSDKVEVRVVREVKRGSQSKARELFDLHKVEFNHNGDNVDVRAENPHKFRAFRKDPFNNLQVEYNVSVPSRYDLDLRTAGGNINITQIDGTVLAGTSGGSIGVKSVHGNVKLQTSGGNVRIGQADGDVVARTSGGSITADSVNGALDAQTAGGNIDVSQLRGSVQAKTAGGSVSAHLTEQPKANCTLKTSGGNVSLSLPAAAAVDVDARTSGGRISSDFGGDLNKNHTKLVAQINGGGPDMVLETSGGNVNIRRK